MTVYGRSVGVEKTLASISKYVCRTWPIIVIFSESNDLPWEKFQNFIQHYLHDRELIVRRTPATGIYPALNAAILEVETDYFTFCHSGDYYVRPLNSTNLDIERLVKYDIFTFPIEIENNVSYPRLNNHISFDISINHMCTFFRKSTHTREMYDPTFRFSADWWAMIQMVNNGATIGESTTALLAFDTNGASSDLSFRRLKEDLFILLVSEWKHRYVIPKLKRMIKEIIGYAYAKIKRSY